MLACRLELQTRNNGKLMVALEELLERLDMPEDIQELLEQTDFDDAKWDLRLALAENTAAFLQCMIVPWRNAIPFLPTPHQCLE